MHLLTRLRLWIVARMRRRSVYYINGPELLPAPLSQESEAECLANIEDADVRARLVEHNLRLVVYIAKRFENAGTGIEDLIMFPIISAGGIVMASILSLTIYKEKLSTLQKLGLMLGVLAIVVLNL